MSDGGLWWETFFGGLWLEVQRDAFWHERADAGADCVEKALGLEPGAAVLDAPCGDARIGRALAARGYAVTGIDLCQPLLDDAQRLADDAGVAIRLARHDLRDLPYEAEFDGVVCYWGSFGYFDDVGNIEQARAAARALKPGGRYLIDGYVAESLLPKFAERSWSRAGDILLAEKRNWDAPPGRVETEWTLIRGEVHETRHTSIRIYTVRETLHLLESAGFGDVTIYGDRDLSPFELGSPRAVVVATKA